MFQDRPGQVELAFGFEERRIVRCERNEMAPKVSVAAFKSGKPDFVLAF
jgi:hypothetical protein